MKKSYIFTLTLVVLVILILSFTSNSLLFTGKAVSEICRDSDNGVREFIGGITAEERTFGTSYKADYCYQGVLREYYCKKGDRKFEKIKCKLGCETESVTFEGETKTAAKCKREQVTPPQPPPVKSFICNDSDGGVNINVPGVVKYIQGGETSYFKDACNAKDNTITEFSCNTTTGLVSSKVKCVGACTNKIAVAFGKNISAAFCDPKEVSCIDTDNGRNYAVNGTASSVDVYGKVITNVDHCSGADFVIEAFCNNSVSKTEKARCNDICQNRTCIERNNLCSDTDNGINLTVKGTVTTFSANTPFESVSDFCVSKAIVGEFACSNFAPNSKTSERIEVVYSACPRGKACAGGICINIS